MIVVSETGMLCVTHPDTKYTFTEIQVGFYVIRSVGYCRVVDIKEGHDPTVGDGIAAALKGSDSFGGGQKVHTASLSLK